MPPSVTDIESAPMNLDKKSLLAWARDHRADFESTLQQFVNTPSAPAERERAGDIRRCAELAQAKIREFGGEATILETDGYPLVHGRFDAGRNLPTVTVYNHLDVQPASRETEPWRTDPFVFSKAGDRYLGRGTTDDKGPALTALFAIRAAREAGVRANIHLLWALEEEIGSPSFYAAMTKYATQLATGSVIVSDTIWVSRERPACPAGLRGLQGFEPTLETAGPDHHSGTSGGSARNALGEFMKVVSKMYDATTGKGKIKRLYYDIAQPPHNQLAD